ncbi:hypothetical protein M9H77_29497 [Catharanthus roseus]|uniref:Uncharacterized protein n=1 Tax=Catharanthus roseus TaxID=4058 RepID=A0ACB9ZWG0_CATRO|nr:hypothetical protein M9H77_29497 [Catharanthus roseus]
MPLLLLENWKAYDQNLNLADQHAKNLGQAAAKHPQATSFSIFCCKMLFFVLYGGKSTKDKTPSSESGLQTPKAILCTKSGRLLEGIRTSPVICSSVTALQKSALEKCKLRIPQIV